MERLILPLIGLVAVIVLSAGGASWWYTHPEPIGWHTRILWKRVGFGPWKSERALRLEAEALAAARKAQIVRLVQASATKKETVRVEVRQAKPIIKTYTRIEERLRDYQPVGADVCARWEDADAKVLQELRR